MPVEVIDCDRETGHLRKCSARRAEKRRLPRSRTNLVVCGRSLCDQLPQQPRGWKAGFPAGAPESFRAGAAVTCWSKRAEFMGRGCGRSLIDTGLQSVPLKLSLVMDPHPQDECYARLHATRNGKGEILATKSDWDASLSLRARAGGTFLWELETSFPFVSPRGQGLRPGSTGFLLGTSATANLCARECPNCGSTGGRDIGCTT